MTSWLMVYHVSCLCNEFTVDLQLQKHNQKAKKGLLLFPGQQTPLGVRSSQLASALYLINSQKTLELK